MRYLACELESLDQQTGECSSPVWVESPAVLDAMPSVEQANAVGGAIFAVCVVVYALRKILNPVVDRTE